METLCSALNSLEKEIMQGTMPGARRRRRPHTAWMDNIKTWTGLSVEESIRMTEDRDKWRRVCGQPADRGRLNTTEQFSHANIQVELRAEHRVSINLNVSGVKNAGIFTFLLPVTLRRETLGVNSQ